MKYNTPVRKALPILLLCMLSACSVFRSPALHGEKQSFRYHEVNGEIEPDEEMAEFIEPYAAPLRDKMDRVLTESKGAFSGDRRGTSGNLAADILRVRAMHEMRTMIDVAVLLNGRLGIPLGGGEINLGHIFELLPYDMHISVLKLNGAQILQLASEIAATGGEPISGMRMRIEDNTARDVLVGHRHVNPEQEYWVATSNWIADGGGTMPTLWQPLERIDHDLLIRDAMIDYLAGKMTIQPITDYRQR
ncbi:MAG: 5'-nucleotidase [Balneolales bacterium]